MSRKINKKFLLNDLLTFFGALILYIVTAVSNNVFGLDNAIANVAVCFLAVAVCALSVILAYRKKSTNCPTGIVNLILPIIFFVLVFVIYFIPIFGFTGNKGVNNSVCLLFAYAFGVKIWLVISCLINSLGVKDKNIPNNSLRGSANIIRYISLYFKYVALGIFTVGVIFSVVNAFLHLIDISDIFNMLLEMFSNMKFHVFGYEIN